MRGVTGRGILVLSVGVAICGFGAAALADVTMPEVFSDTMVLQQGMPIPVWGRAAPGETVAVSFRGETRTAICGSNGQWRVTLPAAKAEPGQVGTDLVVSGRNRVVFSDVLVGEVWLGSGQSNLVWPVRSCARAAQEIPSANHPQIRLNSDTLWPSYRTPHGGWVVCASNTVRGFSALMYYFGRDLHRELGVPVGLIARAVSGSPAGPWISDEGFIAHSGCQADYQAYRRNSYPSLLGAYQAALAAWETNTAPARARAEARIAAIDRTRHEVRLRLEGGIFFLEKPFNDLELRNIDLTLTYDGTNFLPGVTGVAKKYNSATHTGTVSAVRTERGLKLDLALTVQPDKAVGGGQGRYAIDVARRGWDYSGTFTGTFLDTAIAGNVSGGVVPAANEAVPPRPTEPPGREFPGSPGCGSYFSRFIAPLVPYPIRGVVWDQGESGTGLKDISLAHLVDGMAASWRRAWGYDFPFYFVQKPSGGGWTWHPDLKDGKGLPVPRPTLPADPQKTCSPWTTPGRVSFTELMRIPNSGMAIAMDLDSGLHPFNKHGYAARVLRLALAGPYGRAMEPTGPMYGSHVVEGTAIRVTFKHAGAGLEPGGGEPLQGFLVAGADRVFHWADARVEGSTVLVSGAAVPQPIAVRYAWAESPTWANLFNRDGIPALPFRTDDWKGPPAQDAK